MKEKHYFFFHYISLILLLACGYIFFYLAAGNPSKQFNITFIIAVLYVIWGTIHHYLKGDLHTRIVLEYSLIAILAVILVRGALIK